MTTPPTRTPRVLRLLVGAALLPLLLGASLLPSGSTPGAPPEAEAAAPADIREAAERGRDPLGLVRTTSRPRVWILLDTSRSMMDFDGPYYTRLDLARRIMRSVVRGLVSDTGEPLVHWRLAAFQYFLQSEHGIARTEVCTDPTYGAGLPQGSPPGPPTTPITACHGMRVIVAPGPGAECDLEWAQRRVIRRLPDEWNSTRTPNGIALYQLAAHIANTGLDNLEPGQQNIILLITDGLDTCECVFHPWLDFNEGPRGQGDTESVRLFTRADEPRRIPFHEPSRDAISAHNAGLKAKAAFLTLNGGDPNAGLGDIRVVGVGMSDEERQGFTNHLAWMASGLRHPALHADRATDLYGVLTRVLDEITLPTAEAKLGAPRIASVKELVARSPSPDFPGSDPTLSPDALVADPDHEQGYQYGVEEVLRLRSAYADNVVLSTSAELATLRGHLRAYPTSAGGGVINAAPIWDAGERLAARDPDTRLILFNRPGSTALVPFEVGKVTAAELGVGIGYLNELDGTGAWSDADAAEIVVRLVRGQRLTLHPDSESIYTPEGELNFDDGRGAWKLREGLAAPAVVTSPAVHPKDVLRRQSSYRSFFARHLNRRTMVYLPTSGGLLHAFAGDSGEEVFAYIPDDILGPAPGDLGGGTLRDLAQAGLGDLAPEGVGLVKQFGLAGSPVVRDAYLSEAGEWRTVLAFGRFVGGRFVTGLDVTEVGGDWRGGSEAPRAAIGGEGGGERLPRLLFNVGDRPGAFDGDFEGLGETPEPLIVEVPARDGSEWLVLLPGGAGSRGDDSGEWLFALDIEDGAVRARFRLPEGSSPAISKNGAVTAAAEWRPVWGTAGAGDLTTGVYVTDLHGQIHRLDLLDPESWDWRVVHQLGGDRPVITPPVVFPFPGRSEPHLLVVTGGDRRVPGGPSEMTLLRDLGVRFEEVWRKPLPDGEFPEGAPAVLSDGTKVAVVLATRTVAETQGSCGSETTSSGESLLRAFSGSGGAPMVGVVDGASSVRHFGKARLRGVSLSSRGNMALGINEVGGKAFDAVIGDFEFKIDDSALEAVTLFVEGFRRSPFS